MKFSNLSLSKSLSFKFSTEWRRPVGRKGSDINAPNTPNRPTKLCLSWLYHLELGLQFNCVDVHLLSFLIMAVIFLIL